MSGTVWSLPLCFAIAAGAWAADAQNGATIVANESCLACHSVHGAGEGHEASGIAPDLGASVTPTYTVPALASWRVHQDAVNRLKKTDSVEIAVYGPDGKIIRPIFHR